MEQEEPFRITVIPVEYPSESAARRAYEDLDRWLRKGDRDASAYLLGDTQGRDERRILVAVVADETGHAKPIERRLLRSGGELRDIPEADKRVLVERTIDAGAQGLTGRRSYEIAMPLRGMGGDPEHN